MSTTGLSQTYVAVDRSGVLSYGGNQGWLDAPRGHARAVAGFGCGAVAAADLFLYLAKTRGATPLTAGLSDGASVPYAEYIDYVRAVEKNYARVMNHLGMTGFALAAAVNRYFADYEQCFCARWIQRVWTGAPTRESAAKKMLERDIPVVLSIPGAFFKGQALRMYRSARTEQPAEQIRAHSFKGMGGHFVTMTGVLQNGCGDPVYAVSSWGRKYYIDAADYARAARRVQGLFTCGLLDVRESARPPRAFTIRVGLK